MSLSLPIEFHLLFFVAAALGTSYGIIFGGGSFMVLPILFLLGIDPKVAVATNVSAAIVQSLTGIAVFGYFKQINYSIVKRTAPWFLVGALAGVWLLLEIEAEFIKVLVSAAIIAFAIFGLFRNEPMLKGSKNPLNERAPIGLLSLILNGAYQVVVTAGGGTFLTFILIYIYGLRLKDAIYTRQFVNLSAFAVVLILFTYSGLLNWEIFVSLGLGRLVGSLIGSRLVMRSHSKPLAIIFSIVVIILALRTLFF